MEEKQRLKDKTGVQSKAKERECVHEAQAHECSFCGARMMPGQTVCDECGMPAAGVVCPVCGTLNHRSFCSRCNTPLNRAAQVAIEKAQRDPAFVKVKELVEKAQKMKAQMTEKPVAPGEGTLEFLKMFSSDVAFSKVADEDLKQEYEQTMADIERLFAEMLPPAGSTPQQQFNYYSARNIVVTTVTEKEVLIHQPIEWVCNYCGCHHHQPSECAEPFRGGTWIYEDKVVTERTVTKEIKTEE